MFDYINKITSITSMIECVLVKSSRIFGYHNRIQYIITRTFDRLNYKELIIIFQLNL